MFNWGVDQGMIDATPAYRLPKFECGEGKRVLSDEEIARVWIALDSYPDPQIRAITRLLMLTGQRRTEVALTPWHEVDLEAKMWVIEGARTKNGRRQTVPLCDLAVEQFSLLRALNPGSAYITWYPKDRQRMEAGPISPNFVSRIPSRLRDHAPELMEPVKHFVVHNFRHTAATNVGRLTESQETVAHVINHAKRGATPLYDEHTYDKTKREALTLWEGHILKCVERFREKHGG